METLRDYFLEQPVNCPRWPHDTLGNILVCLVDKTEFIKETDITTRLGNSDHLCFEIELTFPITKDDLSTKKEDVYRSDYKTANSKYLQYTEMLLMKGM